MWEPSTRQRSTSQIDLTPGSISCSCKPRMHEECQGMMISRAYRSIPGRPKEQERHRRSSATQSSAAALRFQAPTHCWGRPARRCLCGSGLAHPRLRCPCRPHRILKDRRTSPLSTHSCRFVCLWRRRRCRAPQNPSKRRICAWPRRPRPRRSLSPSP